MLEIITLGAGCFWCVEAVFSSALGVSSVDVGYCNGESKNPTYEMVCSGNTGHAEVAQIAFDPKVVTLIEILDLFFKMSVLTIFFSVFLSIIETSRSE